MASDIIARGLAASAKKGLAGKADLVNGKVPSSELPSYVDDVVEYPDLESFPPEGEAGKIYVALDTGYIYRWSGSRYVMIGVQPSNIPDCPDSTEGIFILRGIVYEGNVTYDWVPDNLLRTTETLYKVTFAVTNGQYEGDLFVYSGSDGSATIIPDEGYSLPSTITVSGASYTYNDSTGVITLSNVTANVSITAVCIV